VSRIAKNLPARLAPVAAVMASLWGAPSLAQEPTAEERIRALEEQLRTLTRELETLKEQVKEQSAQPPPDVQAPPAPSVTADDVAAAKKAQAEAAAAAEKAQAEAAAASSQAAELKERVQTLEQRAEQTPAASLSNGLGFSDPRGRWNARFTGRVQGDYRTYDPSEAIPSTFSVRRARLGLELTAFKDYTFYVEGEFITGNAQGNTTQGASLTNAYLDLNWFSQARFRIGQFKPPIGLENSAPDVLTDFQERSLTQSLLQNLNYDRGIMVHGVPYKGIYYGVSITDGTGLNLEERNVSNQDVDAEGKDFTARLAVNAAQYVALNDAVLHVGAGYKNGTVSNAATQGAAGTSGFVAATGRTEAFGTTFFTPQAFNGVGGVTDATNVDRELIVGELALAWRQFKLQSEYWRADYSGTRLTPPVTPFDRTIDAYYVSGFWMITGEAYADSYGGNATFGRVRPRNNFSFEKGAGWGAWEIGARYSKFDAEDFNNGNAQGTGRLGSSAPTTVSANEAKAWTLQLKWILNPYTRMLVDYIQTDFNTPVTTNGVVYDTEKAITFRAQFDF
jgi:phosphate-selective porin OprO/OprP